MPPTAGGSSPSAMSVQPTWTRRQLLVRFTVSTGAAAVGGAVFRVRGAEAAGYSEAAQRQMLVGLARAGAVFPMELPAEGEAGTSLDRATLSRLLQSESRVTTTRLAVARRGADLLLGAGLSGAPRDALLDGFGRVAASAGAADRAALTAATALAITAVYQRFDPAADDPAATWVNGLVVLANRGQAATVLTRRVAA